MSTQVNYDPLTAAFSHHVIKFERVLTQLKYSVSTHSNCKASASGDLENIKIICFGRRKGKDTFTAKKDITEAQFFEKFVNEDKSNLGQIRFDWELFTQSRIALTVPLESYRKRIYLVFDPTPSVQSIKAIKTESENLQCYV